MLQDPFADVPPSSAQVLVMEAGDTLFRQGQVTSGLYRVQTGIVTLRRATESGDTLTLHRAVAGGYFAEASIYSDMYHCDAICTQAGVITKFAKRAVLQMMQERPQFAAAFTRLLAVQVQQYRAHIELLAIKSAQDRVLAAVRAGYLTSSVVELASRINLTHEACYRALRALCATGQLQRAGRGQYRAV